MELGNNLAADVTLEPVADPPRRAAADNTPVDTPKWKGKRIRIILEENDNISPTGQFIACNGRAYILRPGEEADVPEELVSVLNDAVEDRPIVGPDSRVVGWRKALRFPYRVIANVLR